MATPTELRALTLLRSASLTRDMETSQLRELAALAKEVEFAAGEVIYHRGQFGRAVYLIQSGEVVIETDLPGQGPLTLTTLGRGQFFGWSALYPPERKMASTRAVMPTRVFAFDAEQLRLAWQKDHVLEYAIARRAGLDMAERIKATRRRLTEMLTSEQEV